MDYKIVYDTTPAVNASIEHRQRVYRGDRPVTLVVFIFLQSLRATIIRSDRTRVAGTFISVSASVNTLSMFGLCSPSGIVVDDAIVVVEAVMHHIRHGLNPKRHQAMEVSARLSALRHPRRLCPGRFRAADRTDLQAIRLTIAISIVARLQRVVAPRQPSAPCCRRTHGPARGCWENFRRFNRALDDRAPPPMSAPHQLLVRRSIPIVIVAAVAVAPASALVPRASSRTRDQGPVGVNVALRRRRLSNAGQGAIGRADPESPKRRILSPPSAATAW
jgi:hypothetical protein